MLGKAVDLDHLVAKARAIRDHDLGTGQFFALGLAGQFVIGVDPGLLLGLTRLLALPHPVKFALKRLLLGFVLARFLAQPLGLLFQPCGIVALVGHAAATIQFENPAGDVVQKITVVGDDKDRTLIVDQMLLQPGDGLGVKMVGRLVEQKHFRRFQQQLAKRDTAAFTARQAFDIGVIGRAAQRLHRDIDLRIQIPEVLAVDLVLQLCHLVGGLVAIIHRQFVEAIKLGLLGRDTQHDVVTHVQRRIKMRLLRQIANLGALGGPGLAGEIGIQPGHDLHQGRFTRPVHAHHADFDSGQKAQVNVLETFLAARIGLGNPLHVIDVLIGCHFVPLRLRICNPAHQITPMTRRFNGLAHCARPPDAEVGDRA